MNHLENLVDKYGGKDAVITATSSGGTRRPIVTPASTDARSSHTTTPHAHHTQPVHYETTFQTPNQLNHPH